MMTSEETPEEEELTIGMCPGCGRGAGHPDCHPLTRSEIDRCRKSSFDSQRSETEE